MRVLFVYRFLTLGGVETVLRARLDDLGEHGVEARAWFLEDLGGAEVFSGAGERVTIGRPGELAAWVSSRRPDLVVPIDTPEAFGALGDGRAIAECHSPYLENLRYLETLPADRPWTILVPSAHQADVVRSLAPATVDVQVVPNPLRRPFVAPLHGAVPPPGRQVVAWMSRLDDLKNWRDYLAIGERLLRARPDLELWLAGRTVTPQEIEVVAESARRHGVLPRLRWWYGLPHRHVPHWHDLVRSSGGVFVSTSRGESFGMTVAEAMARACPVVAPAIPVLRELIADGHTGLLYPPEHTDVAAETILALLDDAAERDRLGANARAHVLARHGGAPCMAHLAAVLKGACRVHRAAPAGAR